MESVNRQLVSGFNALSLTASTEIEYLLGSNMKPKRKGNVIKALDHIITYATEMKDFLNSQVEDYKEN